MDENDITSNLKKQFNALPPEVQQAISDVDLSTKLQEIVKNNKLMIDQAGSLELETTLVLFGLEPLENYVKNLQDNVGLSSIQASVVAHDVNELIFKGIREILKKISDQVLEQEKEIATPTKENILAGIEQPEKIKLNFNEPSISMSSLRSNTPAAQEIHPEMAKEGIEIRTNNLPEIYPKAMLPAISVLSPKKTEPFHLNIPPVANIVEAKLNTTVTIPKETIVVTDTTKLPEKPKVSGDPYRESTR